MLAILFPQIDPIFFQAGPLTIRWYAIAYLVGVVFGYLLLKRLDAGKHKIFPQNSRDDLIFYSVLGIIIGGRFGYIFFYDFFLIFSDPISIFFVWKGGMSFHGGAIGLTFSTFLYTKKYKINFLNALDLISIVVPIGLFFGRIANFVNAELYGRATDMPWAVIFPTGGNFGRHPSQIYEAILEGIVLFLIMLLAYKKLNYKKQPGKIAAIFLIFYSAFRFIVEFFREPDLHIGFIFEYMTLGQILSLVSFIIAIACYYRFSNIALVKKAR